VVSGGTSGSKVFSDRTLQRIASVLVFFFLGPLFVFLGAAFVYAVMRVASPDSFSNPFDTWFLVVAAAYILSLLPCLLAGLLVNLVLSDAQKERFGRSAMCGAAAFFLLGLLSLTLLDFKEMQPAIVFLAGGTILTAISAELVWFLSHRRHLKRSNTSL